MNRKKLLEHVEFIANDILSKAEFSGDVIPWKTLALDAKQKAQYINSEIIYSGASGIVLFLMELYRVTRNDKYLKASVKALENVYIYCKSHRLNNFAFYTGRTGTAYCLARLFEITGSQEHKHMALDLVKDSHLYLIEDKAPRDLINGFAGTALGLMHIHSITKDSMVLEKLDIYVAELLRSAYSSKKGFYWDRVHTQVCGLCGYSHGAAGIGFVFGELASYFNNQAFFTIMKEAYLYESQHFDKELNNWYDLRKGLFTEEEYQYQRKKYYEKDRSFFYKGNDMNAWCHGAAGIGFSRQRAYELTGEAKYKKEAAIALRKTNYTELESPNQKSTYSLCHGAGGNADLFIEEYLRSGNKTQLGYAETIAMRGLQSYEQNRYYVSGYATAGNVEDLSLFMGNAGVAYFYLRTLFPEKVPSVLHMPLRTTCKDKLPSTIRFLNADKAQIHTQVLQQTYPQTLARMNDKQRREAFSGEGTSAVKMLEAYMKAIKDKELKAIFNAEFKKKRLDHSVNSHIWRYWELSEAPARTSKLLNTDGSLPTKKAFRLNEGTQNHIQKVASAEKSPYALFHVDFDGVREIPLNSFGYAVISLFKKPQDLDKACTYIAELMDVEDENGLNSVKAAVEQQVLQALNAGILVADE